MGMIFEQFRAGGCLSYLLGCAESYAGMVVDPVISLADRYIASANKHGLKLQYLLDTHTHADHFSASRKLSEQLHIPVIMHRSSPSPFVNIRVDDGETIILGKLRLRILYTPGHTRDSICLQVEDRLLTGDTILIGTTGRTDLPTGDSEQLYESLFSKLLKLPPSLKIYPGHDYEGRECTSLSKELASNQRLQAREREDFMAQMKIKNMNLPTHLTEALRTNTSGGFSVSQLIAEAANRISFMSINDVKARIEAGDMDLTLLDVRESDAYMAGHIPGARHIARGQLELMVDKVFPDPTQRIVVYCEYGKISTLATATLQSMGFGRAVALDGGFKMWLDAGYPIERAQHPA